ncbi:SUKH-3 domain-containing protein [Nocardia sp. NPDC059240]|uniref:SUKH-3 domain-containing protein n=1 Tax=Nocardia sp. NPDC059240 TaxID=3346786 RepID=UPI0036CA811B
MTRFTYETERVLRVSGWWPGRQIDTTAWRERMEQGGFRWNDAADRFLGEFGGLTVDISGSGITAARVPFELDPVLLEGEDDRFTEWGEEIGESIAPLGELDSGRFFLGMSESGVVYLVVDWIASYGPVPEALESLILGRAPTTIADLTTIGVQNTTYTQAFETVVNHFGSKWSHGTFHIDDKDIVETDEMYVFNVGAREWLVEGDVSYALAGGVPVVYKASGQLGSLPSVAVATNPNIRINPNPNPRFARNP